jgi:hypothetical protein
MRYRRRACFDLKRTACCLCSLSGVSVWLLVGPALDPRQLLPALVRFGEPGTDPSKREQVLKYVAYALEQLRCTDRSVGRVGGCCLSGNGAI